MVDLKVVLIWFCTVISFLYKGASLCEVFKRIDNLSQFHNTGQCDFLEDSNGFLWIASSENGLLRYDGRRYIQYLPSNNPNWISSNRVWALVQYNDSILIAGTFGNGLDVFNMNTEVFNNMTTDTSMGSLSDNRIIDIFVDKEGNVWIATMKGLNFTNDIWQQRFFQYHASTGEDLTSRYENLFMCIHQDTRNDDILWLGTTQGLKSFHKKTREFTRHAMPEGILNKGILNEMGDILQIQVRDIIQDDRGVLYMTSWGGGILRFDPANSTWRRWNFEKSSTDISKALSYNIAHGMTWKDSNEFYFASHIGVACFNTTDTSIRFIDKVETDAETAAGKYFYNIFKDSMGNFWLNGATGIFLKRPDDYAFKSVPDVFIDKIIINDHDMLPRKSLFTKSITYDQDIGRLDVHFACPGLGPYPLYYQYKMSGFANEWTNTTDQHICFMNVEKTSNKLEIRAVMEVEGGFVYGNATEMDVLIWKPFYKTNKFYFISVPLLLVLALILFLWKLYVIRKNKRNKEEIEKRIAELEMEALRSQINPHFLFNSLNSIKHFALTRTPFETADYISRFSLLIRKILHNSNEELISLREEIERIKIYLEVEYLRFEEKFNYFIEIDDKLDLDSISVPPMIIQPYVENAIWHGLMHKEGDKKLLISAHQDDESTQISIVDNGIGRVKSAEIYLKRKPLGKKSLGMKITRERVELAKKLFHLNMYVEIIDLYNDETGLPEGTKVVIGIQKNFAK